MTAAMMEVMKTLTVTMKSDEKDSKIEDNGDDTSDNSKDNGNNVKELSDDNLNNKTYKKVQMDQIVDSNYHKRTTRRMILTKVAKVLNTND